MRINLRLVLTFLAIVVSATLWAAVQQEIRISGTVISDGEPLPGVSVQIKGETTGTITDMDGKYSISAPSDAILVYRFVGLKTVEQSVNGRNMINVTLESDSKELDEVMVVAYATAKKYSFTGAASTVKGDEIAKLQVASVSRALEGTVSGVQASAASGQPGTDAEVRIRGIGSINASSAPLYVVDGVPFDGSVNSINPDDIASMTVLKDAASAALYGSRGANGVIIITTKQGQTDSKTTVNVKASFGGSNRAVRDYDRIGTNDYFQLYWEALRNQYAKDTENYTPATAAAQASKDLVTKLMGDGPNPYGTNYPQPVGTDGKLVDGARPLWDFDWSDAMEQQALRTELNLNVSGGGQKNQYFFSAGYLNDKYDDDQRSADVAEGNGKGVCQHRARHRGEYARQQKQTGMHTVNAQNDEVAEHGYKRLNLAEHEEQQVTSEEALLFGGLGNGDGRVALEYRVEYDAADPDSEHGVERRHCRAVGLNGVYGLRYHGNGA